MPFPYPVFGRQADILQRRLPGKWSHTYFRVMPLLFLWLGFVAKSGRRSTCGFAETVDIANDSDDVIKFPLITPLVNYIESGMRRMQLYFVVKTVRLM